MSIVIPKRLEKLLKKDPVWQSNVTQFCRNTEGLYENSPEFFPDYTFHGFGHINEVLEHADALIEQKSLGKLGSRDAAFLACAVILHDAGMFLRFDGVRKLVTGSRRSDRIEHSGDAAWEKVWIDFVDRTKRYPDEKMRYLFGQNITVTESCVAKEDMTDNDKRIIGEFLRQNHGRMAHEIAIHGLPGTEDINLFTGTTFTDQERDLIGLLARSHAMAVRDTEPYVRGIFGRYTLNTPIYYLMVILRMADALDAGKHRISKFRDTQQKVRVPISVEEWTWNERIARNICRWDMKERNRYIHAEPTTSIEYVQLDKWLKRTQAELDLCWSILAEKYPEEHRRLSIHRILCNIHEPGVQETMNARFLTKEVKVTANPEVTRLLIAPLYGDDPSYGVRELLQNAVDACVERKHKEGEGYKGLVTIRVDPWTDPETGKNLGTLTIEDNGIGMNEHVLLNYYLSAGASYRSSDEWKREYTEDGKIQVARTGKFGVGFLATFLLGDSVAVTTCHRDDSIGYAFSFTNKSEPLNVSRVEREVGTTIEIRLKEGVLGKLTMGGGHPWYSWYALDDPEVEYFFNGEKITYRGILLSREPERNPDWHELKTKDFDAYLWNPRESGSAFAHFYCNGIRVYATGINDTLDEDGLKICFPDVSLLDPQIKLEIDLARAKLQAFPEKEALLRQVFRYHIARLLLTQWQDEEDYRQNIAIGFSLNPYDDWGRVSFLLSKRGFTLNYVSFLTAMNISQCVLLYSENGDVCSAVDAAHSLLFDDVPVAVFSSADDIFDQDSVPQAREIQSNLRSPSSFISALRRGKFRLLDALTSRYSIVSSLESIWVRKNVHPIFDSFGSRKLQVSETQIQGYYRLVPDTAHKRSRRNKKQIKPVLTDSCDLLQFPVAVHLVFYYGDGYLQKYADPDLLFPRVLRELLGPNEAHPDRDMWIPFDMEERKKKFPDAFEELAVYIDAIEKDPKAHYVNL